MSELGPQVWHQHKGDHTPTAELIQPISEPLCGRAKPTGGLWTSTLTDDGGSGWVQWCADESFAGPQFRLWQLTPDPNARIYTIDTLDDLKRLARQFPPACDHPRECSQWLMDGGFSWRRVTAAYDAVHLTEEGQWRTRLSMPLNLYGWDCESTLWFRWAFTKVQSLGVRTFQAREWAS